MIDLRHERVNQGKSLAALAEEIEVSERVLAAAETGAHPRPANAYKIASFYGFKVTDIWPVSDREAA